MLECVHRRGGADETHYEPQHDQRDTAPGPCERQAAQLLALAPDEECRQDRDDEAVAVLGLQVPDIVEFTEYMSERQDRGNGGNRKQGIKPYRRASAQRMHRVSALFWEPKIVRGEYDDLVTSLIVVVCERFRPHSD